MRRVKPLIVAGVAVISAAAWLALASVGGEDGDAAQVPTATASVPAVAGYVVHIDPATGEFVAQAQSTVSVVLDESMRNSLSTSSEGLEVVPSPVPGGGMMVNLQGRFQNMFVAAVDETGRVAASCNSSLPRDGNSDVKAAASDENTGEGGER
jgi:hypothetical protein